jgi:hypothetical protein
MCMDGTTQSTLGASLKNDGQTKKADTLHRNGWINLAARIQVLVKEEAIESWIMPLQNIIETTTLLIMMVLLESLVL